MHEFTPTFEPGTAVRVVNKNSRYWEQDGVITITGTSKLRGYMIGLLMAGQSHVLYFKPSELQPIGQTTAQKAAEAERETPCAPRGTESEDE